MIRYCAFESGVVLVEYLYYSIEAPFSHSSSSTFSFTTHKQQTPHNSKSNSVLVTTTLTNKPK